MTLDAAFFDRQSITDLPDATWADQRVLVRADLNVPLADGVITSDFRIQQCLPTLRYLLERGAKVILTSHLGRPKNGPEAQFSLTPVVDRLKTLLPGVTISLVPLPFGEPVTTAVAQLAPGQILVIENSRFEAGETKNDETFSKQLASITDIYVNDAFGAAHRAHSTTEGITHFVSNSVAGILMAKELNAFKGLLANPAKPVCALIGGSKVSSKLGVLQQLVTMVDSLIIGGGMVFTFLKAQGLSVGSSLVEDDYVDIARTILEQAKANGVSVILPTDVVVADTFAADAQTKIVTVNAIPDGWMGLDLGPDSIALIDAELKRVKTVFWNGPLGVFEFPAFAKATMAAAKTIAAQTRANQLVSILGGGDTEAAIEQFQIPHSQYTHVSTGGGAGLELMEGKALPGILALKTKTPANCS